MSASSKKKLRNDQDAGKLTEKQRAEQKQSKEIKFYTIAFAAVMAVLLLVAIFVGGQRMIANSGVRERKTVAYTVGDHALSNAELNFFFVDSVNNFANQYGPYASIMGLDLTKPLNEQYVDEEQTKTWGDDFLNSAKEAAKSTYALADAAVAAGHSLSEADKAQIENIVSNAELYAQISGAGSLKQYLKMSYGPGATEEGYRSYLETSVLADSYRLAYAESLTFEDSDLREAEKENYNAYSSFSYQQYYLDASKFIQGGTEAEDGTVTYSQEEKDAAAKACKAAADTLTAAGTPEELNEAIAALEVNQDSQAAATAYRDSLYSTLGSDTAAWLSDTARKAGDTVALENATNTTDADGNTVTTVNGYTVLMFESVNENTDLLPNIRHILVGFEGGTQDEQGQPVFSDDEKAAARDKAEALLKTFNEGDKTEEAFAALATENTTDPGSKENGGLYENVYPGQMVANFNDWCFDDSRKAGDTGIVESDYGYHVMYYCGEGSLSYRDLQITNELTSKALQEWYEGLISEAVTADGDASLVKTNLVLKRG